MAKNHESGKDRQGDGEIDSGWDAAGNPAVRALLDHLAAELAAEFVRLMKVSISTEGVPERDGETK